MLDHLPLIDGQGAGCEVEEGRWPPVAGATSVAWGRPQNSGEGNFLLFPPLMALPLCPKGPSAFFPFFFMTRSSEEPSFRHNEVILSVGPAYSFWKMSWSVQLIQLNPNSLFKILPLIPSHLLTWLKTHNKNIVWQLEWIQRKTVLVYVSIFWWIPLFPTHSCRWERAGSDLHVNEVNENSARLESFCAVPTKVIPSSPRSRFLLNLTQISRESICESSITLFKAASHFILRLPWMRILWGGRT